jgi:hypothetical protein
MMNCHPKFPIDPRRCKIVAQSRNQRDGLAWRLMDDCLVKVEHHNEWKVGNFYWAWGTWQNSDYSRGKFDWVFNKLFELFVDPQDTNKNTPELLVHLYDKYVKNMMTAR